MEENDFENRVHQKMEHMEMVPSADIWTKVDERLHPENSRRRWLLWFVLIFAGLVTGGYLAWNGNTVPLIGKKPQFIREQAVNHATSDRSVTVESTDKNRSGSGVVVPEPGGLDTQQKAVEKILPELKKSFQKDKFRKASISNTGSLRQRSLRPVLYSSPQDQNTEKKLTGASSRTGKDLPVFAPVSQETNIIRELRPYLFDAPLIRGDSVHISPRSDKPVLPLMNRSPDRSFHWGLVVLGGRPGSSDAVFSKLLPGSAQYLSSPSNGLSTGNSNYVPPSPTKSRTAFKAGIFMQRKVNSWLDVSAGLAYTMFSFSNTVGASVDSAVSVSASTGANRTIVNGFFRTGSSKNYISRYQFLEVPVLLSTNFTSGKRNPFSLELGFSFSRLLSSNALHYDANTGVYFRNNKLFHRSQLSFITGMPVRIYSSHRLQLKAGPQFQYGLTRLLSEQSTSGRHLSFLGLNAALVF